MMARTKHSLVFLAFCTVMVVAVAGCGREIIVPTSEQPVGQGLSPSLVDGDGRGPRRGPRHPAAELVGTGGWINSEPFTLESQRGKVVLLDFWTYTCVNCIRTLPYLKAWHERYAGSGLVILGVHTPEFRFEHELANVGRAVADYGIRWPVVQDNDYQTWDAYNNIFWPSKYLVDKDGLVRHYRAGEGGYEETERWIRVLLEKAGADLSGVEPLYGEGANRGITLQATADAAVEDEPYGGYEAASSDDADLDLDPTFRSTSDAEITSELYGGYARECALKWFSNSGVANPQYCESKDETVFYRDPGIRETHMLYLQGFWVAEEDSLRHGRATTDFEDYMLLRFAAKSVNVVLQPEPGEPSQVLVTLNGKFLDDSNKGEDVVIGLDGRSFLAVDGPGMYAVVEAPAYGVYDLKLSPSSEGLRVFAFTFGVYAKGP